MKRIVTPIALLVCLTMLPLAALAKSNSSNLNRERLVVGRALLEVQAGNLASVIPYYTDDIE